MCRITRGRSFGLITLIFLQGCAAVQPTPTREVSAAVAGIPVGFFVPKGVFGPGGGDAGRKAELGRQPASTFASALGSGLTARLVPEVVLYASPTTNAFFSSGGFDAKLNTQVWEVFLRKYNIPFRVVASVDQLEKALPGILLMPSSVALTSRERLAVAGFRDKGGSVLASWLSGVRDENAAWKGFGFMEGTLNAKVVGDTQADKDDNFMIVHGDSPISHSLLAGLRVWLERVEGFYPLRLEGGHAAANIMDWSRTFVSGKSSGVIVFDERKQPSGLNSRSVVLGYSERLWRSADPKLMEAIAHNALSWLLRQPAAYLSAWPQPYTSAFVMGVETIDTVVDADMRFAKMLEEAGGRATYYVLGDTASKSADLLKKLQARGHEIAYFGDRFEGFRDQPAGTQIKRLESMRQSIKDAGVTLGVDAGFSAPMESYDKTTERLVNESAFGHFVAFKNVTDARLPFIEGGTAATEQTTRSLVVLPRTQTGPEEWMEEGDPDEGLRTFLDEFALAEAMSGLSFVRVPNQSLMTSDQLEVLFKYLKTRSNRMWLATAGQVSQWWRDRQFVSAALEAGPDAPVLVVKITTGKSLSRPLSVWVNVPESGSSLRLADNGAGIKPPQTAAVDTWRASIILDGLPPGEHRWNIYFDRSVRGAAK